MKFVRNCDLESHIKVSHDDDTFQEAFDQSETIRPQSTGMLIE